MAQHLQPRYMILSNPVRNFSELFFPVLQVTAKFTFVVFNHDKFMSLLNFIYKTYTKKSLGIRDSILRDAIKTIYRHCRYVLLGMFNALSIYSCYPFYDFVFNGNLTLVSALLAPFVDPNTLTGYLILTVYNIVLAAWAVVFTYAFSCLFLTFVDVYAGLVSLVEYDFKLFDSMWETKEQFIRQKRKMAFRNIMMQLMDLVE